MFGYMLVFITPVPEPISLLVNSHERKEGRKAATARSQITGARDCFLNKARFFVGCLAGLMLCLIFDGFPQESGGNSLICIEL